MADGGKTSWWKSMTMKKKPKELTDKGAGQENGQFSTDKTSVRESKHSHPMEEKEYLEPKLENGFSEKNTRRNLKISRSGRFKEKRRVRATLPESPKFFEGNGKANDEN
ncbi:proline-rich protein 15-like [Pristis pectinata]|uniref:proline-rich protein 15-like n=1 Tax=Pristis pectinata TaxID=685728 RepID=UPI00223E206D|nr:proline-rich protein 15-like [Pristis pectinata]XP_051872587.1 proline-rich protein 15-like [Pristis pectinata]